MKQEKKDNLTFSLCYAWQKAGAAQFIIDPTRSGCGPCRWKKQAKVRGVIKWRGLATIKAGPEPIQRRGLGNKGIRSGVQGVQVYVCKERFYSAQASGSTRKRTKQTKWLGKKSFPSSPKTPQTLILLGGCAAPRNSSSQMFSKSARNNQETYDRTQIYLTVIYNFLIRLPPPVLCLSRISFAESNFFAASGCRLTTCESLSGFVRRLFVKQFGTCSVISREGTTPIHVIYDV